MIGPPSAAPNSQLREDSFGWPGSQLGGRGRAQVLVGEGEEGLAFELIGAGAGLGHDDGARRVAVFGLVVRRDDLVFVDRELREGIARVAGLTRALLSGDAAEDVVLLAHTIDVDVDVAVELRTAAQVRVALAVDGELHARYLVGKLQEVARVLGQHVDVVQGDDLPDFRGQRFLMDDTGAGDSDLGQKVQLGCRSHLQRYRLLGSSAGIDGVVAGGQSRDHIVSVTARRAVTRESGCLVASGHGCAGPRITGQRCVGRLCPHRGRLRQNSRHRRGDRRAVNALTRVFDTVPITLDGLPMTVGHARPFKG